MKVAGKVVVVTGGAQGIGRALALRFHAAGAAHVVIADRNLPDAVAVARDVGGTAQACDVAEAAEVARLVAETEERIGPIGLFCSNAGIAIMDPEPGNAASAPEADWNRAWAVNVMAHVHAARALVPLMAARGGGHFLHTVSAAGLLSQIGSAIYSTTKHAAIGFAESLAITHRAQGIRVSVLCPQGVDTPMLQAMPTGPQSRDGVLSPEEVADAAVEGLAAERFLILPHAQVAEYMRRKVENYERWIAGMAKLRGEFSKAEE
jgi:NAD(P)-dependent dehydrogenase (short-subunit alcohol dehydrogenase family)